MMWSAFVIQYEEPGMQDYVDSLIQEVAERVV